MSVAAPGGPPVISLGPTAIVIQPADVVWERATLVDSVNPRVHEERPGAMVTTAPVEPVVVSASQSADHVSVAARPLSPIRSTAHVSIVTGKRKERRAAVAAPIRPVPIHAERRLFPGKRAPPARPLAPLRERPAVFSDSEPVVTEVRHTEHKRCGVCFTTGEGCAAFSIPDIIGRCCTRCADEYYAHPF